MSDHNANTVMIYQNLSSGGTLTTNSFAAPVILSVDTDPQEDIKSGIWMGMGGRTSSLPTQAASTISIFRTSGRRVPSQPTRLRRRWIWWRH